MVTKWQKPRICSEYVRRPSEMGLGGYVDGPDLLRHQNICHEMLPSQKVLSRAEGNA
jgi:hypothetical protein